MSRIQSVDFFRVLAVMAVIVIHASPFRDVSVETDSAYHYLDVFLNQIARFSVPFFFVISGYFWGWKVRSGASIKSTSINMLKRISMIFLVWSMVYALPYNVGSVYEYGVIGPVKVAGWNVIYLLSNPVDLLMQGTKEHLWFLVGLLFAIGITAPFAHYGSCRSLAVVACVLYFVGLAAKAYSDSPFGIDIAFNTRNGPFFGTLFFVTGYWMSGHIPKTGWLYVGAVLFLAGCCLHFSEIYILWKWYNTSVYQDYVVGTYFMGLGVAVMALSNHPLVKSERISSLGRYTLGIYTVHFVFIDVFKPFDKKIDMVVWEIGFVALVFLFSMGAVLILSKIKKIKQFVV